MILYLVLLKITFCEEFAKLMHGEFEMSMMEKLNYFIDLQIRKEKEGIFIKQTKYIKKILRKFGIKNKSIGTPISNTCKARQG